MKKTLLTLSVALMGITSAFAWSTSTIRENARFLSDRMAYELDMTPQQYDDCYEINYDFFCSINPIMTDVVRGYGDAIDQYYTYLDWRNDDLRYIMNATQYVKFMNLEYFYRPIYTYRSNWLMRVHQIYNNHKFFYFNAPSIYKSYRGGHSRSHFQSGFYGIGGRYNHQIHKEPAKIKGSKNADTHSRSDFGNNRRDRGAKQQTNGYSNSSQKNREQDQRYQDERKGQNKNTPQINHREQQQSQGNAQQGSSSSKPQGNGSGQSRSGRR